MPVCDFTRNSLKHFQLKLSVVLLFIFFKGMLYSNSHIIKRFLVLKHVEKDRFLLITDNPYCLTYSNIYLVINN